MSNTWWNGLTPEGIQAVRRKIESRDERIEELEAKLSEQEALLAKAMWALAPYADLHEHHAIDAPKWGPFSSVSAQVAIVYLRDAAETLAELKGNK